MSEVLRAQGLTKVYPLGERSVTALADVSFSIEQGEVVLIMGPSGAGKSTLLSIIGCLLRPTSGEVFVDGVEATRLHEGERAAMRREKIGFIFQHFNLFEALSARANVEVVFWRAGIHGGPSRRRAEELLAMMGLHGRSNHRPKQLSGGEKQRVAIARALANNPLVVLADEPTASLDSASGRDIARQLRQVARELGKGVLIVSHDVRVREVADRMLWLEDGRLREGEQTGRAGDGSV